MVAERGAPRKDVQSYRKTDNVANEKATSEYGRAHRSRKISTTESSRECYCRDTSTEQPYPNGEDVSRYLQLTSDACKSYRRTGVDAGGVDRSIEKPASEYRSTAELDRWTRSPNFRTNQASFRFGSDAD